MTVHKLLMLSYVVPIGRHTNRRDILSPGHPPSGSRQWWGSRCYILHRCAVTVYFQYYTLLSRIHKFDRTSFSSFNTSIPFLVSIFYQNKIALDLRFDNRKS